MAGPACAANVAVLLSSDAEEYKEALKGFKETAGHPVVAVHDMDADPDRGRKLLGEIDKKVKPDLIFAVGTWALQVVAGQTDIPVVYAMVLNPPSAVDPGVKNVTGASMNVPVEQSLRVLKQLGPQIKRIGVIFNRARTGYLVKEAGAVAREDGSNSSPGRSLTERGAAGAGGPAGRDRRALDRAGREQHIAGYVCLWGSITLAFLALSALVLWGFSRRITRPINRLTEQAKRISAPTGSRARS